MLAGALGVRSYFKEFQAEVAADTTGNMHVKIEKFVDMLMDQYYEHFETDQEAEDFLMDTSDTVNDAQYREACRIEETYVQSDYDETVFTECVEQLLIECGDIFQDEDEASAFLTGEY